MHGVLRIPMDKLHAAGHSDRGTSVIVRQLMNTMWTMILIEDEDPED